MKKLLALLVMILGIVVSCEDVAEVEVTSVNLNETELSLYVGDTFQLVAEVLPENVEDKTVTWSVEDTEIVSIGQDGLVTALHVGSSKVYAKAGDIVSECIVTVSDIPVETVALDEEHLEMYTGDEYQLTAIILPVEASGRQKTWSSSDNEIVSVSDDGLVTAISVGEAVVTVEVEGKSASCSVVVNEILVESVTLNKETAEIIVGNTEQLTATVLPENADNKNITWSSTDESIATVSSDGLVSAISVGSASIIAKAGDKQAKCDVTVIGVPVESITLDKTSVETSLGSKFELTATVLPENAYDKTVKWSSSDESIITVYYGKVSAIAYGTATITAEAGGKVATCEVTVTKNEVNVGDFYYSDGTWSENLDPEKQCIGIVFYAGNPSEDDNSLATAHPDCINGLVVSLEETNEVVWQENYAEIPEMVGEWVENNTDNENLTITDHMDDSQMGLIRGYNNTKGLEMYNEASENSSHAVAVVSKLAQFRESVPTPESTSGWYIPSVKELTLMCSGDTDSNIWYSYGTVILNLINEKISALGHGTPIGQNTFYWASTERDSNRAFKINGGSLGEVLKESALNVRYVLAF